MGVSLGPGKFYGSSLPRPRIYTNVKNSTHRVDPPVSVVDPLLSWANEAHWSMGGLSTKRLRLQGRIEGNNSKLRADHEKLAGQKITIESHRPTPDELTCSPSPPPAPAGKGNRKRRFVALIDEEKEEEVVEIEAEEEEVEVEAVGAEEKKRKPARKLIDESDSVATENVTLPVSATASARRTSPRSGSKKSNTTQKSEGGSLVSRMQKASQALVQMRRSGGSFGSANGSVWPKARTSPRLVKLK